MDAKELQSLRRKVEKQEYIDSQPDYTHDLKIAVPELLDYIDALKADMAGIRKRAHELTAIPHPAIMKMAAEIYNLAAQHADEPENGA